MDYHIYNDPTELATDLADQIVKLAAGFIKKNNVFNIALSGGNTPSILFKKLAGKYPGISEWSKVNFFWVDERCVPPDNEQSNYGVVNKLLFQELKTIPGGIYRMMGENEPVYEARRYSEEILRTVRKVKGIPQFDLILLGMGDDGHTASIFPDNMDLLNSGEVCETAIHPQSGQSRVTLTGKVINNALNVFFMVTGQTKARLIYEIFKGGINADSYPAAKIQPHHGSVVWLIDKAAAAMIDS